MRFTKPSSRALVLTLLGGFAAAALLCVQRTSTPPIAAQPKLPVSARATQEESARGDAATIDAATPDAATPDAATPDAGPTDPTCLSQAMGNLEPHARWLARFEGTPAADERAPPKIGELRDLRTLPPSQLAFVRSGRVYVMDLPGGGERAVSSGGHDSNPRWSPRGTHVAFLRDEQDTSHVYMVRADGSELRQLGAAPALGRPAFSDDGRYLAFAVYDKDIVIHDLDTSAERRITTSERVLLGPVFEPSSHRLAFGSRNEVLVADAVTGRASSRELPNVIEVQSVAFVPGALLVSVTSDAAPGGSFVVRHDPIDRPGPFDVEYLPTPLGAAGVGLFASPHGSRIALENNSLARTFVPEPDGATLAKYGDWWRRDVIVYDRRRPQWTIQVSDLPQPRFLLQSPAWAPDDRHLAFVVDLRDNDNNDYVPIARGIVAVDTNAPRAAPVHVACGESPSWGPAAGR